MKKNRRLVFIGLDVLVLVMVIGVSLATFNYVKKGSSNNVITSGRIVMNYSGTSNTINIASMTSKTDEEGKTLGLSSDPEDLCNQSGAQCYFDFYVSTVMNVNESISYEVTAEKDTNSTLGSSDVKLYLEKYISDTELTEDEQKNISDWTEVFTPKAYTPIDEENPTVEDDLGAKGSEMLLDNGTTTKSKYVYYRLRMWLADGYSKADEEKTFSAKVNVYGANIEVNGSSGITLSKNSITLQKGRSSDPIVATVKPDNTKNKNLIWESSNKSIATASSNGVITAGNTTGNVIITVYTSDRTKSATINVEVVDLDAEDIELDTTSVRLTTGGEAYQINAKVMPNGAVNDTLTYTSNNTNIVTVGTNDGLIVPVSAGTATITISTDNGIEKTLNVEVVDAVAERIEITEQNITMDIGNKKSLTTRVTPSSISNVHILYTSSDTSKVTVDGGGRLTALAETETDTPVVITASIKEYPTLTTTTEVTVQKPKIESITMSSDMTVTVGSSTTFTIWISPELVRDQGNIEWISANENVAVIPDSCKGSLTCTIIGQSDGTDNPSSTITARMSTDHSKSSSKTLTVAKPNEIVLADYISNLWKKAGAKTASTVTTSDTLFADSTADNNIRYTGVSSSVNNYVWFNCDSEGTNCEKWRIIGVMNNVKSSASGTGETRIKLRTSSDIGGLSWDTSSSGTNKGYGYNRWDTSALMRLLNDGYSSQSIGGSLYYNQNKGSCYYSDGNGYTTCNYTGVADNNYAINSKGLTSNAKTFIGDAYWPLGASDNWDLYASGIYAYEHGNVAAGAGGSTGWVGKVALAGLSDYMYSNHYCLKDILYRNHLNCSSRTWMFNWNNVWYLNSFSGNNYQVWYQHTGGNYTSIYTSNRFRVYPTVYLKSNVVVKQDGADGSYDHPYNIGLPS